LKKIILVLSFTKAGPSQKPYYTELCTAAWRKFHKKLPVLRNGVRLEMRGVERKEALRQDRKREKKIRRIKRCTK